MIPSKGWPIQRLEHSKARAAGMAPESRENAGHIVVESTVYPVHGITFLGKVSHVRLIIALPVEQVVIHVGA